MSARVVQRYVLDEIDGESLRVFVVWGPMLGDESEEDARGATAFLPDPRARHYWTGVHALAEELAVPLGLEGERAWDTYLVYPPGAEWGEAPPRPAYFMHVGKSLDPALRLNGATLRAAIERLQRTAGAAPLADGREELLAADLARFAAMVDADLPALDRLLAEDLTYTHTDGRVESKAEFLAAVGSGGLDYQTIERQEVTARLYGDTAILTGVAAIGVALGERRAQVRLRFTSVYVRGADGAWRLAAWHSAALRDPEPS